jgi:hypothetical protein
VSLSRAVTATALGLELGTGPPRRVRPSRRVRDRTRRAAGVVTWLSAFEPTTGRHGSNRYRVSLAALLERESAERRRQPPTPRRPRVSNRKTSRHRRSPHAPKAMARIGFQPRAPKRRPTHRAPQLAWLVRRARRRRQEASRSRPLGPPGEPRTARAMVAPRRPPARTTRPSCSNCSSAPEPSLPGRGSGGAIPGPRRASSGAFFGFTCAKTAAGPPVPRPRLASGAR